MKPDINKLVADAEREQLYGSITLEFRRGAVAVVRTEKTQIYDNRTEERTNNNASIKR
jgi:hypothetical protein